MLVWGSSCARPHRTCVCLPQGIQPRDSARPVPRNFKTAEFMPDWWGSGPPQLGWPLSWTPAWVRPPENWRNRRCRFRVQGPESSAKGHSHVEKPLQPVQGLALTGSHPGHLALKMTLSALAFQSLSFPLWPSLFILSEAISNCFLLFVLLLSIILDTFSSGAGVRWGAHRVSYVFAFAYRSWGPHGKNTERSFHFLVQWINFVRTLHYVPSLLSGPMWHDSQLH